MHGHPLQDSREPLLDSPVAVGTVSPFGDIAAFVVRSHGHAPATVTVWEIVRASGMGLRKSSSGSSSSGRGAAAVAEAVAVRGQQKQ